MRRRLSIGRRNRKDPETWVVTSKTSLQRNYLEETGRIRTSKLVKTSRRLWNTESSKITKYNNDNSGSSFYCKTNRKMGVTIQLTYLLTDWLTGWEIRLETSDLVRENPPPLRNPQVDHQTCSENSKESWERETWGEGIPKSESSSHPSSVPSVVRLQLRLERQVCSSDHSLSVERKCRVLGPNLWSFRGVFIRFWQLVSISPKVNS